MSDDDPNHRLLTGLFCDKCQSSTNDCFWKCAQCNNGDWGFCRKCVDQSKCCSHPLLPICLVDGRSDRQQQQVRSDGVSSSAGSFSTMYKALSVSTTCDLCTCPIAASMTRFHCPECNAGDYDICANCYFKLVASGRISKENGHNGWRRCANGHRMEVIGFEGYNDDGNGDDGEVQQRRVIIRGLVGGHALKDDYTPSQRYRHPIPSGSRGRSHLPGPELGSGDWSWREGSERRKKASRVRITPTAMTNSDISSSSLSSRSSSGEYAPTISPGNGAGSDTVIPQFQFQVPFASSSSSSVAASIPASPQYQSAHSHQNRFPPDGGVGLIVHARWPWIPEDDVTDELLFPRGAVITEVENINDDWFWGCYAGETGLFPGGHVAVVGEVTI